MTAERTRNVFALGLGLAVVAFLVFCIVGAANDFWGDAIEAESGGSTGGCSLGVEGHQKYLTDYQKEFDLIEAYLRQEYKAGRIEADTKIQLYYLIGETYADGYRVNPERWPATMTQEVADAIYALVQADHPRLWLVAVLTDRESTYYGINMCGHRYVCTSGEPQQPEMAAYNYSHTEFTKVNDMWYIGETKYKKTYFHIVKWTPPAA